VAYIWFGITINLANALSDKGKGCAVNANNVIMHACCSFYTVISAVTDSRFAFTLHLFDFE